MENEDVIAPDADDDQHTAEMNRAEVSDAKDEAVNTQSDWNRHRQLQHRREANEHGPYVHHHVDETNTNDDRQFDQVGLCRRKRFALLELLRD